MISSQKRRRHLVAASERRLKAALPTSPRPNKREIICRRRHTREVCTAAVSPQMPQNAELTAEENDQSHATKAATVSTEISLPCSASALPDNLETPPSPPATPTSRRSSCPILIVSQQRKAAPIEQTFHAIAHNKLKPEIAAYPAVMATSPMETGHKNTSIFIHRPPSTSNAEPQNEAVARLANMLKTSRQMTVADSYDMLHHQLQQNACSEPSIQTTLEREAERVYREYRSLLLQWRLPMMESIDRCTEKRALEIGSSRMSGRQRYQVMRNAAEERNNHRKRIAQLLQFWRTYVNICIYRSFRIMVRYQTYSLVRAVSAQLPVEYLW